MVSTKRNVYCTKNPVPDDSLLKELKRRYRKLVTTDGARSSFPSRLPLVVAVLLISNTFVLAPSRILMPIGTMRITAGGRR